MVVISEHMGFKRHRNASACVISILSAGTMLYADRSSLDDSVAEAKQFSLLRYILSNRAIITSVFFCFSLRNCESVLRRYCGDSAAREYRVLRKMRLTIIDGDDADVLTCIDDSQTDGVF